MKPAPDWWPNWCLADLHVPAQAETDLNNGDSAAQIFGLELQR